MEIFKIVVTVVYVIAAIAIIAVVLMQEGKSAGLGSLSGSTSNNDSYWDKNKKHSLEGKFERWTKITAGLFVVLALVLMIIPNTTNTTTPDSTTEIVTPTTGDTAPATETPVATEAPTATESPAADAEAEVAPQQ